MLKQLPFIKYFYGPGGARFLTHAALFNLQNNLWSGVCSQFLELEIGGVQAHRELPQTR